MKKLITFFLLPFFLFIGCGDSEPIIVIVDDKDDDNDDNIEEIINYYPPEDMLFTTENPDAKNSIIGVWSIIYDGMGEDTDTYTHSLGIREFLPDGTYRTYINYPDEYVDDGSYQISDRYCYLNGTWPEDIPEEERGYGGKIYTYKIYDDKLRLELAWGVYTWNDVYIFKRLDSDR